MNAAPRLSDSPRPNAAAEADLCQELVSCLLCGGDDYRTVLIAADPVTGLGGNFRVVECRECGLAFTNPRPTVASIGQFYPVDYAPHAERGHRSSLRDRIARRLERAVLRTSFGYPPAARPGTRIASCLGRLMIRGSRQRQTWFPFRPPGRLLDFGCGAGGFLREMRDFGWQVEGLDVSAPVAAQVEQSTGIRVRAGTLPHPELRGESFDAVTMWNSLEHVHRPRETVKAARELLRPGGLLVIGVQNFESWSAGMFREHWHGLELPRHLTQFTPATLRRMLETEGFRVRSIDQIGRVGWIRHSARRSLQAGNARWWTKLLTWKPVAKAIAGWSDNQDYQAQRRKLQTLASKRAAGARPCQQNFAGLGRNPRATCQD
ncbi:MAG: class I SAM-dependent methyltransferase, partial [Planctomycetaceae bacterium]